MPKSAPLAERLRPESLDFFLGQEHLGPRITSLLSADHLPSILFFGPPGCGKSTLALLLAKRFQKKSIRLSAPETGVQNLRKALDGKDLLILDEIHRFSKAQQDFFLPLIENGDLTLLATTTENPSFSVTRQLLSRLHVLQMRPLSFSAMHSLAVRGVSEMKKDLSDDVIQVLCNAANGDGRTLLNLVEYVCATEGDVDVKRVQALLPDMLLRHDKKGDSHYEYASALIKSIRGSDPDAAIYYLACLLEGGEDPRFICRRLILSASEDVGLADPNALPLAVACQEAVEFVGMPEGYLPMAETCVYLALARKSNSAYAAYLKAKQEIKENGAAAVPLHLRNATTALQKQWGYGREYKYPHAYPDGWVPQEYLPKEVAGKRFFFPKENGDEFRLTQWWRKIQGRSHPKK